VGKEIIMPFEDLKIDVKSVFTPEGSESAKDSCVFLYGNNDINWFATDYLMSDSVPEGSKNVTKGMIRYFLEYLNNYENWQHGTALVKPVPMGEVTDKHLFNFVGYIEDDIGLNRNGIVRRVKSALSLLEFIQNTYNLDYKLISISSNNEYIEKGLTNAKWLINQFTGKRYLHHECLPDIEDYPSRNPITEEAIESLYDDLDKLAESGQELKHEMLTALIGLLEKTGIRVSEAANIDEHTIELLRLQLTSWLNGTPIDLTELAKAAKLTIDKKSLKAAEAIYRRSKISKGSHDLVWIPIKTTKGKKKNKIRLIPIPVASAQYLVRFYDDYIVNELDRVRAGEHKINRKKHKKLFIQPETHAPMTGVMLSSLFYDVFSRQYKSAKHKRSPHLFRHRFITCLVLQQLKSLNSKFGGQQLASLILKRIQGLTGHASIATMLHYVELAEAEIQDPDEKSEDIAFDDETREVLIEKYGEDEVAIIEYEIIKKRTENREQRK